MYPKNKPCLYGYCYSSSVFTVCFTRNVTSPVKFILFIIIIITIAITIILYCSIIYYILATLVIRDLTLRVFAIARFRGKKTWKNCTVILQSRCTVVAWLCGARTSWSHLTSISVRGSVKLASPVDVERSSFIFKAMGKISRPNCDRNGYKCKKQRKAVTLEEKLSVIHFTRFRVTRWFLGTN
jgi:hypothetical protein